MSPGELQYVLAQLAAAMAQTPENRAQAESAYAGSQSTLTKEYEEAQKEAENKGFLGQVGEALGGAGGAALGQALIPIPGVGAAIGGTIGGTAGGQLAGSPEGFGSALGRNAMGNFLSAGVGAGTDALGQYASSLKDARYADFGKEASAQLAEAATPVAPPNSADFLAGLTENMPAQNGLVDLSGYDIPVPQAAPQAAPIAQATQAASPKATGVLPNVPAASGKERFAHTMSSALTHMGTPIGQSTLEYLRPPRPEADIPYGLDPRYVQAAQDRRREDERHAEEMALQRATLAQQGNIANREISSRETLGRAGMRTDKDIASARNETATSIANLDNTAREDLQKLVGTQRMGELRAGARINRREQEWLWDQEQKRGIGAYAPRGGSGDGGSEKPMGWDEYLSRNLIQKNKDTGEYQQMIVGEDGRILDIIPWKPVKLTPPGSPGTPDQEATERGGTPTPVRTEAELLGQGALNTRTENKTKSLEEALQRRRAQTGETVGTYIAGKGLSVERWLRTTVNNLSSPNEAFIMLSNVRDPNSARFMALEGISKEKVQKAINGGYPNIIPAGDPDYELFYETAALNSGIESVERYSQSARDRANLNPYNR